MITVVRVHQSNETLQLNASNLKKAMLPYFSFLNIMKDKVYINYPNNSFLP